LLFNIEIVLSPISLKADTTSRERGLQQGPTNLLAKTHPVADNPADWAIPVDKGEAVEAVHPRTNETDADTSVIAGATQDNSEKWLHLEWQYLVIATKFYCVFIDKELDIDWSTTPEREARGADDPAQYHQIMGEVSALETAPCDGLGNDVKLHYKRLIGEAISRNFEDQYESARRMLATAEAYYRARSGETSRRWYLIASFKAVAPIVLAGGLLWLGRPFAMALVGPGAFKVLIAAVAGALGALLSVITRSRGD
jgi:hypothetical protein